MHHNFLENLKDELHKSRIVVFAVFCFCMAATFSFLAASRPLRTSAAPVQGFNPGNIISDTLMADYNSMTVEEIQDFLTSKNSCKNKDYELYLSQTAAYKTVSWHWSGTADDGHFVCLSEERFGEGTEIGSGQTAAEIIYEAAQASRINPRVLIVLLEKEQGLISDTFPHSGQYRAATGYGCPDTAACDSKYYGFKNQVFRAAELFRYTLDNGYYLYPENKPGVFVAYNPSYACGGTNVLIENRATAALYRYTPYQPNAAALAAGYGQGDTCSAYGNRNFYLLFTDWFGSTGAEPSAPDTNDPAGDSDKEDPSDDNDNQSTEEKPASQPLPDGIYTIHSAANTDKALDVSGAKDQDGANVQLWFSNGTSAQSWQITYNSSTDDYTIRNTMSGRALDLDAALVDVRTNIQLYKYNGTCAQRWKLLPTTNNSYAIASACDPGYVIDIDNAKIQDGTNIQLWFKNGTPAQDWQFKAK